MGEAREYIDGLPDWAVKDLDDILVFTAPEMRRLKILKLMSELVAAADETKDVE